MIKFILRKLNVITMYRKVKNSFFFWVFERECRIFFYYNFGLMNVRNIFRVV